MEAKQLAHSSIVYFCIAQVTMTKSIPETINTQKQKGKPLGGFLGAIT